MSPTSPEPVPSTGSRLRLQTIVRLRWIAVIGQLAAVLGTYVLLGLDLPIGMSLSWIAGSAGLNVLLRLRFSARHRLSVPFATAILAYDVVQLSALLYFTGGVQNPFAFLIIVPMTVASATLPAWSVLAIGALTMAAAGVLAQFYMPLPWPADDGFDVPLLYKSGIVASILCCLAFMGLYVRRLAKEATQMSDALAATENVLAREQELHALDGLAAAAAHELGTPLATITLVTKELSREMPKDSPHAEDIALLRSQAQRCRVILERLRSNERDPLHARLPLTHLIEEAVEPYRVFEKSIRINCGAQPGVTGPAAVEPVGERQPGVLYGLTNLVENAVDFARSEVSIAAHWNEERVAITISDDGPGFLPSVLRSLGEPYVTTRGPAGRRKSGKHGAGGLGLGFFIAKTLLERSGAELTLTNRAQPAMGAVVGISWPRRVFEPHLAAAPASVAVS